MSSKDEIRDKFREFVAVKRSLLMTFGPTEGIYLSQLIDWEDRLEKSGVIQENEPFFLSSTLIEKYTGLTKDQQYKLLKSLKDAGVVKVDRKGLPAKNYYTIDYDKIKQMETQTGTSVPIQFRLTTRQASLDDETNNNKTNSNKINDPKGSYFPSENIPLKGTGNQQNDSRTLPTLRLRTNRNPIVFENPAPRYDKDSLFIINYWNSSPNLPKHRVPGNIGGVSISPTRTFENLIQIIKKVINGTFYNSVGLTQYNRPYSVEEITSVIDKYKLVATNPSYLPQNKQIFKNIGLNDFFYNSFSNGTPSQFLRYLEEEPKLMSSVVPLQKEKNPQLTKWLKEAYVTKVLAGSDRQFNPVEENKFILGANQLHETIRKMQGKLNMLTKPIDWCNFVIDSLLDAWKGQDIQIGHISSEYTYSETLIKYMKKKGRIG